MIIRNRNIYLQPAVSLEFNDVNHFITLTEATIRYRSDKILTVSLTCVSRQPPKRCKFYYRTLRSRLHGCNGRLFKRRIVHPILLSHWRVQRWSSNNIVYKLQYIVELHSIRDYGVSNLFRGLFRPCDWMRLLWRRNDTAQSIAATIPRKIWIARLSKLKILK